MRPACLHRALKITACILCAATLSTPTCPARGVENAAGAAADPAPLSPGPTSNLNPAASLAAQPGAAIVRDLGRDHVEVTLPTALPSGYPRDDTIWLQFFPARGTSGTAAPALILLHQLGSDERDPVITRFATSLAAAGINCASMCLPFHGRRLPPGENGVHGGLRFTDDDVDKVVQAWQQTASDVSTVVTWLTQQPGVDPRRIGAAGVSLGAIATHLAMGKDNRLTAGVAILGAGDLPDIRRSGIISYIQKHSYAGKADPVAIAALKTVDPLTYAGENRPRRVLMINAARDIVVPPRDATELWNALGHPPIRWVDTNHFGLGITPAAVIAVTAAYLRSVWGSPAAPALTGSAPVVLPLHAITLKLGIVFGIDTIAAPALQWQFYSFATRPDHMSLIHTDLGLGSHGPFLGLAVTVNPYLDLGIARRAAGHALRPYASLHIVF